MISSGFYVVTWVLGLNRERTGKRGHGVFIYIHSWPGCCLGLRMIDLYSNFVSVRWSEEGAIGAISGYFCSKLQLCYHRHLSSIRGLLVLWGFGFSSCNPRWLELKKIALVFVLSYPKGHKMCLVVIYS